MEREHQGRLQDAERARFPSDASSAEAPTSDNAISRQLANCARTAQCDPEAYVREPCKFLAEEEEQHQKDHAAHGHDCDGARTRHGYDSRSRKGPSSDESRHTSDYIDDPNGNAVEQRLVRIIWHRQSQQCRPN